jgi:putative ABC transport system ATP-binding protein
MNREKVARLAEICHVYGNGKQKVQALTDITLTITKGEFVAISGPSGSGKSTLLHILGCLMQPTSGSYLLRGQETSQLNKNALAKIRNTTFGFVFQNFNLLPRASAIQNVTLPLIYAGVKRRERLRRALELMDRVGLGDRISHRPNELSGGEQQRVAIARALANRPSILLADEPTGNLDSTTSKNIVSIFEDLVNEGFTVVLVSHDRNVVDRATRRIRLADSRLMEKESSIT